MKNYYKTIKGWTKRVVLLGMISLGLCAGSFAQTIVLEDNFNNFDPNNAEKYACSEYWAKYEDNGNNVAFLSEFYDGDQFGIKVSLSAETYSFAFKIKRQYGSDNNNLICSWNEASASGTGGESRWVYNESMGNTDTYLTISTASFTVETAGVYVLYINLGSADGCVMSIDDFVVYSGDEVPDCSAVINLESEVLGSMVKLNWERPNCTKVIDETFEGDFPPAGWETVVTNTYDGTVTWHKFDNMELDPKPYEGNGCASVFWDIDPQDEWLIIPVNKGDIYLDFWFWMSDYILTLKQQEGFSDHYYVKVSYDGGTTWEVLWDAVASCLGTNDWERVSLNLGNVTDNTKVAFQALSGEQGLYLNWFVDNVTVSNASGNGVISSFNVYRNDTKVASDVKMDLYIDLDVPIGSYEYCVTANYESCESEKTCVDAVVGEVPCNKPKITRYEIKPNNNKPGTWDVRFFWDEPEYSGRDVYYYNCYRNGGMIAMWVEDNNFGQIEVTEGTYRYAVTAVYRQPDCESEKEVIDIVVGENNTDCLPVDNVKAVVNGSKVELTWNARENVEKYSIYRAGVEIASNVTVTSYTDNEAPNGTYDYCVIANYADGCVSNYDLFSCATVKVGDVVVYSLPFREDFSTQHKPKDWEVTDLMNPQSGMIWRFNNPSNVAVEGSAFDRSFAIIDSDCYGFGQMQNTELITPLIDCAKTNWQGIFLTFDMQFITTGDEGTAASDAYLYISNDGGKTWSQVDKFTPEYILAEDQVPSPAKNVSYDISNKALGRDQVKIKWRYSAQWALHLAIDNVSIEGGIGVNNLIDNSVRIYPNPSKGSVNIDSIEDVKEIMVMDATGKVCYKASSVEGVLNLSHLKNGVYVMRIVTSNGISSHKLIMEK